MPSPRDPHADADVADGDPFRRRAAPTPPRKSARALAGGRGFRLGRAFGVELQVDWSVLLIFALITFNLGAGVFPAWHPGWGAPMIWGVALGAALLFFASILVHELSHAVVARRYGIPVERITLFIFGGMAHMEGEPPTPKSEFLMAIVGPITSITLGALATLGAWALGADPEAAAANPEALLRGLGPAATLLLWLGPVNLILGVFNLVPGFPLDGGRVLRSVLWWVTGDMVKATRWAAGGGHLVAWTLMAIGVLNLFAGDMIGGLWLLLIGWFLSNAARMSYQQLLVRRALEGVPVARLMTTHVATVDPDLSIEALVREHLVRDDQRAYPVLERGHLEGLVSFEDVRAVPHDRWNSTPVAAIMTPAAELVTIGPDADAEDALTELARADVEQLPVVQGDRIIGLVRQRDIVRWLSLQSPELIGERAA